MGKRFEKEVARRFIAERYGEAVGQTLAELGGGDWSRAYSFEWQGQPLVVRFGNHVEDFYKDQMAMRFSSPDMPIPEVLEVGKMHESYYAISRRHEGVFLETLSAEEWQRVLPALLRGLTALREIPLEGGVDWSASSTQPPLSWHEWLTSSLVDQEGGRVSGWRSLLRTLPHCESVFVEGERVLRSLLPLCPEIRHIIHRDLLNRNVLVSADATRLEAVFDWGCSLAGDFLYEIAWLTFWAPWHPAIHTLSLRQAVPEYYASMGIQIENCEQRLSCYELHIGLEHIAYCAFSSRPDDLEAVTQATAQVLDRLSR